MQIEWSLLAPLLALVVLTLLLTGPGLWSEEWGWWWFKKRDRRDPRR